MPQQFVQVARGIDLRNLAEESRALVAVAQQRGFFFQSLLFGGEPVFKRMRF
jgi:hypothetical protein